MVRSSGQPTSQLVAVGSFQPHCIAPNRAPPKDHQLLSLFVARGIKRRVRLRKLAANFPDSQVNGTDSIAGFGSVGCSAIMKTLSKFSPDVQRRDKMPLPDYRPQKHSPIPLKLPAAPRQLAFRGARVVIGIPRPQKNHRPPAFSQRHANDNANDPENFANTGTRTSPRRSAPDRKQRATTKKPLHFVRLLKTPKAAEFCLPTARRPASNERLLLEPTLRKPPRRRCKDRSG